MLKKQIGHLIVVSMKHFFDLDYMFCHHALLMGLVMLSVIKLFFTQILDLFRDGVHTVQMDFAEVKASIADYKQKWEQSEAREVVTYNIDVVKNIFATRFKDWKLD